MFLKISLSLSLSLSLSCISSDLFGLLTIQNFWKRSLILFLKLLYLEHASLCLSLYTKKKNPKKFFHMYII